MVTARQYCVIALLVVLSISPQVVIAVEEIRDLHIDATLYENGNMSVTETFILRAEGNKVKLGTSRYYQNLQYSPNGMRYRRNRVEIKSVSRDKNAIPYHPGFHNVNHKIYTRYHLYETGKRLPTIPGDYQYEIHYTTNRQIQSTSDADRFCWDIPLWSTLPLDQGVVRIRIPDDVDIRQSRLSANIVRTFGVDTEHFLTISQTESREWIIEIPNIPEARGIAIQLDFPPNSFLPQPLSTWFTEQYSTAAVAVAGLIVVVTYFYVIRNRGVENRKGGVETYSAPDDRLPLDEHGNTLSPADARFFYNPFFGVDRIGAYASIWNMVVRKTVELKSHKGEILLTPLAPIDENGVAPDEERLFHALFLGDNNAKVRELCRSNPVKLLSSFVERHGKIVSHRNKSKKYFTPNYGRIITGILLGLLAFFAVPATEAVIADDWIAMFAPFLFCIIWNGLVGIFVLTNVMLWSDRKTLIIGFLMSLFLSPFVLIGLCAIATCVLNTTVLLIPLVIVLIWYNLRTLDTTPTWSEDGAAIRAQVLRLKRFLSRRPSEWETPFSENRFVQFFPYAVALDAVEPWCRRFATIPLADRMRELQEQLSKTISTEG